MKKITLSIALSLLCFYAMADTIRETGTFTSRCGVNWNYVIRYEESMNTAATITDRYLHLSALMDKADAACGTAVQSIISSISIT